MPTYDRAGQDVREFVNEVMSQYHLNLVEAEVTVGVLFAHPTEKEAEEGPPPYLKANGYTAAAVVKINSAVERLQGMADATVTLDARTWRDLDEPGRTALIDHELQHISIVISKEGDLKSDDAGRPKLRIRLHDVQVGWFLEIARRHGAASFEVQQARTIKDEYGQLLWAWDDDTAPADARPDVARELAR